MRKLLLAACLLVGGSLGHAANPAGITKAFVDGTGALHIIAANGEDHTIRPQKWQAGGGFEQVAIAPDHRTVAWLATQMLSPLEGGTNYAYAVGSEVDVWRGGHIIRKFPAPVFTIQEWTFLQNGNQVAFHVRPPHGEDFYDCYLFDVSTGKRISHWSREPKRLSMPAWAGTLLRGELAPASEIN